MFCETRLLVVEGDHGREGANEDAVARERQSRVKHPLQSNNTNYNMTSKSFFEEVKTGK